MGRRAKPLPILHPPGRNYACRDCPARCCTSSWGIPVSKEECERILSDDEARQRLGTRGTAILKAGVLPMHERGEKLACVFLDEDLLCSLHKRHGHEFIPAPCQAFPFGFSENEKQQPVALLSRYCPSIRDNYGEPVQDVIADKLKQAGGAAPMAEKMGLRSGRTLPRSQYVAVVEEWVRLFRSSDDSPALCRIYDFNDAIDEALPSDRRPTDVEIRQLISSAQFGEEQLLPQGLGFSGRVMISHLLGGICYPSRVMLAHRMTPITWFEKVRSWMNRLAWLFGVGKVRLLFVDAPVRVARVRSVAAFLQGQLGQLVTEYLCEILGRRQGMQKQTYLSRVVADLTLMTVLISHYARAAASAEGLPNVAEHHVKEGIGIAELLFSHQGDAGQSVVLHQLRLNLMSNRADLRKLLAAEM